MFDKLYFSSAFNYSNPNVNVSALHSTLHFDFQVVSAMRFFKNASRAEVVHKPGGKTKAMYNLGRARPQKRIH